MKYAIEIGSGTIEIGSGVQKLLWKIHRQHGDLISSLLFIQNKKTRLKRTFKYLACNTYINV
jgi:hypothetical protein